MSSTLAPLTEPRQEPVSDLLPRGCGHFPGFQGSYPSSNFLAPRCLDICFRHRLQALQQGARDLGPFVVGQTQRLLQQDLDSRHKTILPDLGTRDRGGKCLSTGRL